MCEQLEVMVLHTTVVNEGALPGVVMASHQSSSEAAAYY